ncbi:MAG TPA: hypothetical protein VN081_06830 [Dongiaceae bacterium]|nr:hypothetical protein [Dongiaceae bacterium]
MARIRTIKPEFWTDEKVVELSAFARLLFIGIWNFCDDEGRMVHSPKRMKMQIFPADSIDCAELIGEIQRASLITIYAVDGIEYLQVLGFAKHQKIDKRSPSKLPSPPNSAESPRVPPTEGKGMDQGMEGEGNSVPSGTGGEPPSGQSETAKTPEQMTKDELWVAGKSILEAAGMPKAQCGTFVGGLVKQYTAEIVHASVLAAVIERPADPASFLKAACMARKGEGGKTLIPWHATDAGVIAKGAELGMSANRGETSIQFKARVIAALDNAGKSPAARASPPVTVMAAEPKRVEVPIPPELKAKRSEELKAAMRAKT